MSISGESSDIVRLQTYIEHHIPLVKAMAVRVERYDPQDALVLRAPLAPNRNHQGTAFGGSLHGIATLAAWSLLWLLLEDETDVRIVVRDSHMNYRRAVTGAIVARCAPPAPVDYNRFIATLRRRGKARIAMVAEIVEEGSIAATFEGRFVAMV